MIFRVAMGLVTAVVLAFLLLPVLALVPMSLSRTTWLSFPPRALTLEWYARVLADREWREAALTSLTVAGLAAAVAGAVGIPAGVALGGAGALPPSVRRALRGLALAPVAVPLMLVAIALYWGFAAAGIGGTLLALVLAHATIGLPYVVLTAESAARTVDPVLARAARSLGASAAQAFRRVTLPLLAAGIGTGLLFAVIVSLDEAVVALFVAGPRTTTLPRKMWSTITQDEFDPLLTAVASLQVGVALALLGAVAGLGAAGRRARERLMVTADEPAPSGGGGGSRPPAAGAAPAGAGEGGAATAAGGASLALAGLTKRFGAVTAVDGLTLGVAPGEILTLLGPSGCGKSTVLNLVAGFETPDAGHVTIDDRRVDRLAPERRAVGLVVQDYALFPHLSVAENVAFPLRVRRVPGAEIARRVGEMLELVRLPGLEARLPRQLSGGQRQRVALARALVYRPRVLLLDEPLAALDRGLRERMQGELRALLRRLRITTVLVTHDQAEAMAMADRIAVLRAGRLLQVGSAADLYERPADAFVAAFVGESNLLAARVVGVEGERAVIETDGGARLAVPRGAVPPGARVVALLRPEALALEAAGPPEPGVLDGVVEEVTYLGATLRLHVRLSSGELLRVSRPRGQPGPVAAVGSRARLRVAPGETRLLAAESGDA